MKVKMPAPKITPKAAAPSKGRSMIQLLGTCQARSGWGKCQTPASCKP